MRSAPFPGAQIYVKVRLEPNPSIVWLHFCIRDDQGSLSRAALIETANLLLTRRISKKDNVLPTPPTRVRKGSERDLLLRFSPQPSCASSGR